MRRPERVWLLRHAETVTPTVFHGAESDVGLSDLGRRQAAAAADWFRPLRPTAVISSGMRRALDTATPISTACGVALRTEPDLHERKVGALCGMEFSMVEGPWAETVKRWSSGESGYTSHGAESYDDLRARLLAAWDRVIEAAPDDRLVVVAHGVVCKVLLLTLLGGWGPEGWVRLGRVANLSVSELVATGAGWRADRLLTIPEPVAALSDGHPTGIGEVRMKSEA